MLRGSSWQSAIGKSLPELNDTRADTEHVAIISAAGRQRAELWQNDRAAAGMDGAVVIARYLAFGGGGVPGAEVPVYYCLRIPREIRPRLEVDELVP